MTLDQVLHLAAGEQRAVRALAKKLELSHEQLEARLALNADRPKPFRFLRLHVDELAALVREYNQLVGARDAWERFAGTLVQGPPHEIGCPASATGIPLVGCPACEWKHERETGAPL